MLARTRSDKRKFCANLTYTAHQFKRFKALDHFQYALRLDDLSFSILLVYVLRFHSQMTNNEMLHQDYDNMIFNIF